jgi:outer membrane biosynthesis protein TonB
MTPSIAPPPETTAPAARPPLRLRTAALWSVCAHLLIIIGAIVVSRASAPPPLPPTYSVELVAAPPGPRALGAVEQGPSASTPAVRPTAAPVAPPPPATGTNLAARKPAPAKPAAKPATKARPAPPKSGGDAAVKGAKPAGGGPTGGRGRDVASVRVQGIAFPYPGYLENITRQIALNFKPRPGVSLKAEVAFLIHRDGSVSDLRLVNRSGTYAFDLECMGAVEAVGQRKSFGALPAGFRDDVLPVVFSFDPSVLR